MCFCCRNRYNIFFGLLQGLSSRFQRVFVAKKAATEKQDLLYREFYLNTRNDIRLVQHRIQPPDMIMPVPTMPSAQAEMGETAAHTANPTAASSASTGRVASPAERSVDRLSAKRAAGGGATGKCSAGRCAAGERPTEEHTALERVTASCAATSCVTASCATASCAAA